MWAKVTEPIVEAEARFAAVTVVVTMVVIVVSAVGLAAFGVGETVRTERSQH